MDKSVLIKRDEGGIRGPNGNGRKCNKKNPLMMTTVSELIFGRKIIFA